MPVESSARRSPSSRGRGLSIRQKLVAMLVLPTLVMTVLATVVAGGAVGDAGRADRLGQAAHFTVALTDLAHELQRERDLTAAYVASSRKAFHGDMILQRVSVNDTLRAVRGELATLDPDAYGLRLREQLGRIDEQFSQLERLRGEVDDAKRGDPQEIIDVFTTMVATFVEAEAAIGSETDDGTFARDLATAVAISRTKEAAAIERSGMLTALAAGKLDAGALERISSLAGGERTWLSQFRASATDAQRRTYERTVTGPDVERFDRLRAQVFAQAQQGGAQVDPQDWLLVANARVDLFRQVESGLVSDVVTASQATVEANRRGARIVMVAVVIAVLLSLSFSLLVARAMVKALSKLRDAATDVATRQLPEAVERLRTAHRPEEAVTRPEPISLGTQDEMDEVAGAFNAVHTVAVEIATRQAALRCSVGDLFLNLARRNQAMIDRQLELIEDLERGEADPDTLRELFRLQHLATRMRRTAEDLIVLSGARPPRIWSRPVPVLEALRGAVAEIEDYTRVEVLPPHRAAIVGTAASDVVHLVAELIENATAFSPASAPVNVSGSLVTKGYVIEIEDQGVGMTDSQLLEANLRLAEPSEADLELSERLGLFVVGRLATRHGINVQLRHSWYGGIVALVLLPTELVVQDEAVMPALAAPGANGALPARAPADRAGPRGIEAAHVPFGRHASLPRRLAAQMLPPARTRNP
jgi:Nitrate and nitrite sensing/Histidine kinase-, DNA gyrase B-, and HSP90-like ATPase